MNSIAPAEINDAAELVALINSAYRGESSKKGWTTEADLLDGEIRTDIASITALLENSDATILKYTSTEGKITGSVYLEKQEKGLYLGMLSVSPLEQALGIGKHLMQEAEAYAKQNDCSLIFMKVISVRHELIAWYEKQGYHKTDEVQPFTDTKFGTPKQPNEFIVLEKKLNC